MVSAQVRCGICVAANETVLQARVLVTNIAISGPNKLSNCAILRETTHMAWTHWLHRAAGGMSAL